MAQDIIKKLEDKGLDAGFAVNNRGQVFCGRESVAMQSEIAQMATVIFETIGAVGELSIDRIQIIGGSKGVIAEISKDKMLGTFLNGDDLDSVNSIFTVLEGLIDVEIQGEEAAKKPERVVEEMEPVIDEVKKPVEKPVVRPIEKTVEKPEVAVEKQKVKLDAGILDTMKSILKDYVGDFSERIFNNQLKAQRIKSEELYDEDARRLIFALGKAAGMIIGPSKGRDMTNKLLAVLK